MADENQKGEEVSATLTFDLRADDVTKAERMAAALEKMGKAQIEYNKALASQPGGGGGGGPGSGSGGSGGGGGGGGPRSPRGPTPPQPGPWPNGMDLSAQAPQVRPTWPNGMPLAWNPMTGMNRDPWGQNAIAPNSTQRPFDQQTIGVPWNAPRDTWRDSLNSAGDKFSSGVGTMVGAPGVAAAYRNFGVRGLVGGAATAGVVLTKGAAEARNATDLTMYSGGTGSDTARAGLNSNWFTRQGLGIYDSFSNRQGEFGKAEIRAERAELTRQRDQVLGRRGEVTGSIDYEMGIRRSETRSRIKAMNDDPRTATMPFIDRSTVGGEFEFGVARGRQPIIEQGLNIGREGMALRTQEKDNAAMLARTQAERKALDDRRRKLLLEAGTDEDSSLPNSTERDTKRLEAARELERVDADISKNMERQNELLERQKGLKGQILQNTREQKENQLAMIQLQQREWAERGQVAAGQEGNVGRMGPLERQFALQSALLVKDTADLDQLPDDVLGAAGRLIPKTMEKRYEEKGANDPITKVLKEQFGDEYRDSSKDARFKEQQLGNQAITLKFEIQKSFQEGVNKELLSDKMIELTKMVARQEAADAVNAAIAKLAARQNPK